MKKHEVVIIGAGPAGLSAAIELAKAGKDVLVIEKNQSGQINTKGETKLCGGGLLPASQSILTNFDLKSEEHRNVVIKLADKPVPLKFSNPYIKTINRAELARKLEQRAKKAGAEIIFATSVSKINFEKKTLVVGDDEIEYSVLIGADGALSAVRSALEKKGLIEKERHMAQALEYKIPKADLKIPLTVYLNYKYFSGSYAWVFPHEDCYYIGAGEDAEMRKRKKTPLVEDLKKWAKSESLPFDNSTMRGWVLPYGGEKYSFPGDVYLVGDAAGFVSPLYGEGISPALLSGHDVAHLILDKNYRPKHIERQIKRNKTERRILSFANTFPGALIAFLKVAVKLMGHRDAFYKFVTWTGISPKQVDKSVGL